VKNIRTFELKLGKKALIFFVLGMSCLLFVVFLLGVQMGKMMDAWPEKFSKGIPSMIMERFGGWPTTKSDTDVAAVASAREDQGKMKLTFYDTLAQKRKNTDAEEQVDSVNGLEPTKAASPRSTDTGVEKQETPKVVEKPSDGGLKKQETPKVVGKPSEKTVSEKYQVQVVSLREKEKAQQLCKKLISLGYAPRIMTAELKGKGTWFRVVLDDFDSREKAQKASDMISKKLSGVDCVIKKKNN
jgi:cell division septation protein DedD